MTETKGQQSTITLGNIGKSRPTEKQGKKSVNISKTSGGTNITSNSNVNSVNVNDGVVSVGVGVDCGAGNDVGAGSGSAGSVTVGSGESAFRPKVATGKKYPQLGQGPLTRRFSGSEGGDSGAAVGRKA